MQQEKKWDSRIFIPLETFLRVSSYWQIADHMGQNLELLFKTFRRHLSIESFSIFAVVIDHEVISDSLHLTNLATAQLAVSRGSPPVRWGSGGTLIDTHWPIPLASSCPKPTEAGNERCTFPVNLDQPASCCPIIRIP